MCMLAAHVTPRVVLMPQIAPEGVGTEIGIPHIAHLWVLVKQVGSIAHWLYLIQAGEEAIREPAI